MTRELQDHEHATTETAGLLAVDAEHDPAIARRTSLAGLDREAARQDVPEVLHGKQDAPAHAPATAAPSTAAPSTTHVSAKSDRSAGEQASYDGIDAAMVLLAHRMQDAGTRIDALNMPSTNNAGGPSFRALQVEALYNEIDAQLVALIAQAKQAQLGDGVRGSTGLRMIKRADQAHFGPIAANTVAHFKSIQSPVNIDLAKVPDHIAALGHALHFATVDQRSVSGLDDAKLVNKAIEYEAKAARTNAIAARNRLGGKESIDLEIERVVAATVALAELLESHAKNAKQNGDPDRRLRLVVVKDNRQELNLALSDLALLENRLQQARQQPARAKVHAARERLRGLTR